jgi:hypothetical protein
MAEETKAQIDFAAARAAVVRALIDPSVTIGHVVPLPMYRLTAPNLAVTDPILAPLFADSVGRMWAEIHRDGRSELRCIYDLRMLIPNKMPEAIRIGVPASWPEIPAAEDGQVGPDIAPPNVVPAGEAGIVVEPFKQGTLGDLLIHNSGDKRMIVWALSVEEFYAARK